MISGYKTWLAGVALALMAAAAAGSAMAADDNTVVPTGAGTATGTGGEGVEANNVIVTAERSRAAAAAPTKAPLEETQPESIISHKFIEQVTPETGGWTTVLSIAPSVSQGASSNGGGIGDYQTPILRGFPDGEYNITYDGIAFGDTNNPTHHSADYFPASTIGYVVIDRGPGAAGDLGQANFGGAIHFFSPEVSNTFGVVQKLTYGSFDSIGSVTTINTGTLPQLLGGKLLLNFEERTSAGELTHTGGYLWNQLVKYVLPIGDKLTLTAMGTHEYTRFNFPDSNGPGETWQQTQLYGRNFSLTAIPDEFDYKFNYERKQTDFEYIDLKYQAMPTLSVENQVYTYWYANHTKSTNDNSGIVGGPNTSPPMAAGANPNDIGGYDKLNGYRVLGDIVRVNQQWSFGTLKVGGLVERADTERHNCFEDFSTDSSPDDKFKPPKFPFTTNCKLLEFSDWQQEQAFADFDWTPTDSLKISPGFKYVIFKRDVDATDENVGGGSKNQGLIATNTYSSPLYFLTANYKIRPDWSVYGQVATSFLIPELSELYVTGANIQHLQSEYTTNYQAGTVYAHGDVTADADVYLIEATNLQVACTIPNDPGLGATCNQGKAQFSGVEGEAAYAFPFGLTLFANGSINAARQLATPANPAAGITTALVAEELPNAPGWTDAFGAIYTQGPWQASLTYKQSGAYVVYNTVNSIQHVFSLSGFDTIDGSVSYDFGRFKVKLQGFNLLDRRAITNFVPQSNATSLFSPTGPTTGNAGDGFYTFQTGRDIQLTVIGKF